MRAAHFEQQAADSGAVQPAVAKLFFGNMKLPVDSGAMSGLPDQMSRDCCS